jgi:hypothetical protein
VEQQLRGDALASRLGAQMELKQKEEEAHWPRLAVSHSLGLL